MILVDTSVWITHLRGGNRTLSRLLMDNEVAAHPFVIGEMALGRLRNRRQVLSLLADLPHAPLATPEEALHLIEARALFGQGCGYVDIHLLAAVLLQPGLRLWSYDKALAALAQAHNVGYAAPMETQ